MITANEIVTLNYIVTLKTTKAKENKSLNFNLKIIGDRRNYFIKEIKQRDLMSRKNKNVSAAINYVEQLFILVSAITRGVSVSPLLYFLVFW